MTPTCNVCRYTVEWLRACYSSRWRLFRARPDLETSGRYVFSPLGNPHYPGFHLFGSRIWTAGEGAVEEVVGEVRSGAHPFYSGELHAFPQPRAIVLGDEECIAQGERFPLPVVARTFYEGFDSRCWLLAPILPDIGARPVLLDYANVGQLFPDNPTASAALLEAMLGPGSVVTVVPNSGSVIPGTLIGTNGTYAVVYISGTSNVQQLALEAVYSLLGPTDQGIYGTSPLWEAAWLEIHTRIVAAGISPDMPILFVGHSYGGVVATLLTARYTLAQPGRDISLITYGLPKPGDQRLLDLVANVRQTHVTNAGDLVVAVPPTGIESVPFLPVIGFDLWRNWNNWASPPNQLRLETDGALAPGQPDTLSIVFLTVAIPAWLTNNPLATIVPHEIKSYFLRLAM